MTKNKLVVLFLSLVLLLTFTTMSFAKNTGPKKVVEKNTVRDGNFKVFSVQADTPEQSRYLSKKAAKESRLSKQYVINSNLERSYLNSTEKLSIPLLNEVPGGGAIHSVWNVSFDYEDDFNTFTPVDLSENGAGNDWFWLDYVGMFGWPESDRGSNSAFAPEPGGDIGGDVVSKDEAIDIKVGIPKMSSEGEAYRVSNLMLELYIGEPDPDDFLSVEILEAPKWHVTDDAVWTMNSDQVYAEEGAAGYDNAFVENLVSTPISVPAGATLSFQHMINSEGEWDGANVKVSADNGETWEVITPAEGYDIDNLYSFSYHGGIANGVDADPDVAYDWDEPGFTGHYDWTPVSFDLSAYEGQTIIIKWQFTSDGMTVEDDGGWWIDDIVVTDGTTAVFENDGVDDGSLIAERQGPGYIGEPWVTLSKWSAIGGGSNGVVSANLNLTSNIIGAPGDSATFRFRAYFDDNDEGDGADPNWGFEVSDAILEVYTRYSVDLGVSFVDLDSTFSKNEFITVGETLDPQLVVSNYGLSDVTIYNTFVKIVNNFGSTVYERYLYTYAPAQGDTLDLYPGTQEFGEGMGFYDFPDWTPEYQGDYTLIAYTEIFGGDDEPADDSLVVDFHVYGEDPAIAENFNTMTSDELYANWEFEGALDQANSWYIGDSFGKGDNELWILKYGDDLSFDEQIVTPVMDCSEMTDVALKLEHHISGSVTDPFEAKIIISTDGGATFQDFKVFTEATPVAERRGIFTYDVSSIVDGKAAVQIGFTYKTDAKLAAAGGYLYFTVDDLSVYPSASLDITDPGTPVNFAGVAGDMQVDLTWSGLETASYYSILAADTNDVAVAEVVAEVSDSMATIDGLTNGETMYFWVTSTDFNDNESAPSESVELTPADVTAPTQITDLHAADVDGETAKLLTWTAPVETAPAEGTVYEIRYAYMPITPATWDDAMALDEVPEVAAAGTEQSLTVPVDRLQDYYFDVYFAIKTTDEVGNVSEMSNPAHADDILPGNVVDLTVVDVTEEDVTLSWTAPGDDGVVAGGPVWGYQVRVAYDSLGDEFTGWESAQILTDVPAPSAPGETEYYTAVEFVYTDYGQTFGIVAIDWNGNVSEVIGMAYAPSWDNFNPQAVEENTIPETFALNQNYPNPFNPTTSISYQLPNTTHVKLEVFGTNGQKIRTLVNGTMSAGNHNVQWDAMDARGMKVASGIYFYRLETSAFTSVKKMTLMK